MIPAIRRRSHSLAGCQPEAGPRPAAARLRPPGRRRGRVDSAWSRPVPRPRPRPPPVWRQRLADSEPAASAGLRQLTELTSGVRDIPPAAIASLAGRRRAPRVGLRGSESVTVPCSVVSRCYGPAWPGLPAGPTGRAGVPIMIASWKRAITRLRLGAAVSDRCRIPKSRSSLKLRVPSRSLNGRRISAAVEGGRGGCQRPTPAAAA